jgi:uncharacterized protein with GYD domain
MEAAMINISLVNFTDQGIRNVKDSPARNRAFQELCKKNNVTVRGVYYTAGQYDLVVITEGNEEAITATLLGIGKLGNVRTQSLRAMDLETFQRILEKVN